MMAKLQPKMQLIDMEEFEFDNLKIRKDVSNKFKYLAKINGMKYSSLLERLMDESPLAKYFEAVVKRKQAIRQHNGESNGSLIDEIKF